MENITKYTFWKLLSEFEVKIPKIQRDYAQGRKDAEATRIAKVFLDDLQRSICNSKELSLDFVYGRVEGEIKDDVLIPLDGQQRLTTLFLIHWYIALKEGKLDDDTKETLSKFTYETRPSSSDFCKGLVNEGIDRDLLKDKSEISDLIIDSKWYFLSWQRDPTVSAMLNMLDTIHAKFKDVDDHLFEKLCNENECDITFHFLALKKFNLTDELYIKMNARGKPLTKFENLKAVLSQYFKTEEDKAKLDNKWLDIFWSLSVKENEENKLAKNADEKFFAFLENATINLYAETLDKKDKVNKFDVAEFNIFDHYKDIYSQDKYIENISTILDSLTKYDDPDCIFKDITLSSQTPLTYWQRLRFYSLGRFFIKHGSVTDENKAIFDRWMRVCRNLINNTPIDNVNDFVNGIRSIKELSTHSNDLYSYLNSPDANIKFFLIAQREEECLKANLILEDSDWEILFIEIERHSYFDGQIGFILEYSKTEGNKYAKTLFSNYSSILAKLFGEEFQENHDRDFLFQRALLTKGDYLPQAGNYNRTFCVFDDALRTKNDNWRKVFSDTYKTQCLKKLLDDIDKDNIQHSLETIIKNHDASDWRKIIIDEPSCIDYCEQKQIRKRSNNEIYLLKKSQRNGEHSELYSRSLFKKFELIKKQEKLPLRFFDIPVYSPNKYTDDKSTIILKHETNENIFEVKIAYNKDDSCTYDMEIYAWQNSTVKLLPDKIAQDIKSSGFGEKTENGNILLSISISEDAIEGKLNDICSALENYSIA